MDKPGKPTVEEIRRALSESPKQRERDLAASLGISELELVAAQCGNGVTRLTLDVNAILRGLEPVGEVMALTRNESAVHEKIGPYDKVMGGDHAIIALGEQIDLRIFPTVWKHGFAVEKQVEGSVRHSLQFFDAAGTAVHKVHLRDASNLEAYRALVAAHLSSDQTPGAAVEAILDAEDDQPSASVDELRERWSKLTDTHQFFGMLRSLKLSRRDAMRMVGRDYAWQVEADAIRSMMEGASQSAMPIMCFVGNHGCIQIHSGPVKSIRPMGPWLNVLDETFHLHLRTDHIVEIWGVRKPTKDGHVTSLEAYDANGEMIIQFFGKRKEGFDERPDWRRLIEALPQLENRAA